MKKILTIILIPSLILLAFGCDKERVVTTTEYVHDIEYVEGALDTILLIDTLMQVDTIWGSDSTIVYVHDTVIRIDTTVVTEYVHDTVTVIDTVTIYQQVHDTVTIVDTVVSQESEAYVHFAYVALEVQLDPQVINLIYTEYGYTDGWITYLSLAMTYVDNPSYGVYDMYGYIDYWTPDWSGYALFEYYWRVTYQGGDPADPANWSLSEPPAGTAPWPGGLRPATDQEMKAPLSGLNRGIQLLSPQQR
ncbi:MAG: hypothetical protein ABII79_08850 [bacterium]